MCVVQFTKIKKVERQKLFDYRNFNSNTCWFVERSAREIWGKECLYDGRILYKENNRVFLYKKKGY